jgi:hypothetical protein
MTSSGCGYHLSGEIALLGRLSVRCMDVAQLTVRPGHGNLCNAAHHDGVCVHAGQADAAASRSQAMATSTSSLAECSGKYRGKGAEIGHESRGYQELA